MSDSKRPRKHKQYTEEAMLMAIKGVQEARMSIMFASKVYDIPRKTLSDRINGTHSFSGGPSTILTPEEEGYLVNYIQYMARRCFPLSITQICGFAWVIVLKSGRDRINGTHSFSGGPSTILTPEEEGYLVNYIQYMARRCFPLSITQICGFAWVIGGREKQFKESGPSEKCWRGFKKRHTNEITLHNPDNLGHGRDRMANATVLERHFKTLKELMIEKGVFNKPEALYNVDE